jgi:hypothetical protein
MARRSSRPKAPPAKKFNPADYPTDDEASEDLDATAVEDMYESESEMEEELADFIVSDDEEGAEALSIVRSMISFSDAARRAARGDSDLESAEDSSVDEYSYDEEEVDYEYE